MKASKYNYYIESKNLVVNLISTSIIELEEDKYKGLKLNCLNVFSDEEISALKDMLFITDCENEREFYTKNKLIQKQKNKLGLTILPTTTCNARCHYCYQSTISGKAMDRLTQENLFDFIKKRCPDRLHITWFGGEPLLNTAAIDYISDNCIKHNINFYSTIITNGYCIDKYLEKMKSSWRIKSAQITIDGINEKYNKCKNYIYKDSSPFEKVITNIHNLIENGIQVAIRMNFDKNNYLDILEAIDYIHEKFGNHKNLRIYANNIYGEPDSFHLEDNTNIYLLVYKKLINYGYINNIRDLRIYARDSYCFIYDENHFVVSPKGELFKCEHAILDDCTGKIGNLEQGITSQTNYDFWQNENIPYPECQNCKFWFVCQGGCKHQQYFADYNGSQCVWIKEIFEDIIKIYYEYKEGLS